MGASFRLFVRQGRKKLNQKEFENIAKELRARSLSVAHGFHFTAEEAEDVAQDALLKLWALHATTADTAAAEALTVSITRHLCIDILRRRHTVPLDSRPVIDDRYASPDTALETNEDELWLQQRLKTLPSNEYAVLQLRQVEGKTDADIAAILGISPSSVPTLLSRARHKLLADIMRRRKE